MSTWMMIFFQDSNSPVMENLIWFHDYVMMILLMIVSLIIYMFMYLFLNKLNNRFILSGNLIELIWTFIPMFILIFMAIPSLKILYFNDEVMNLMMTIKSMGHQWYWSYEYSDFLMIDFNSFMLQSMDLNSFRLLDVDNRLILPNNLIIRLLISSVDVIHSWTIPSIGVKIDATPGRLNQMLMYLYRSGIYYGQCSEICGTNHSFMPIVIEVINFENFINWIKNF
uniref:Cytochrome c oxidase subunit 2 n=1 Tax=Taeniogonalos taihorina TaxID=1515605 RepID=A0A0K0KBI7_9HYME|nr:cytochrome c oxidase subunit II [Taeniogonalos taihorina]AIE11785.1 cytochrome c oxidase subunit II [Taeniogonalos taihorina]